MLKITYKPDYKIIPCFPDRNPPRVNSMRSILELGLILWIGRFKTVVIDGESEPCSHSDTQFGEKLPNRSAIYPNSIISFQNSFNIDHIIMKVNFLQYFPSHLQNKIFLSKYFETNKQWRF